MEISQEKKPVVMQILPGLQSGGVERGVIDIAKALKKSDFEPIVVSKGGILVYQLREAGIAHIELPVHSKNPLTIYSNNKKIAKLIAEYHVDIVHVRSRAPMWSAYFACKKTHTKLVATVHGTYSLNLFGWKIFPLKRIYNALMLKADEIIAVSGFIKDYLIKNYQKNHLTSLADKIVTIQRGAELGYFDYAKVSKSRIIDLSKKWHLPDDKKIILMPARFTAWKGHEFLIEALSQVKNDFFCVMIGSDHGHKKFRKRIENKIVEKNLAGKVQLCGICKDMPTAYAVSHLVVCPSVRAEAFGRIAIEAQASSRIIIATKIGGSLETVIDGKTGFLVEVGDVEKFAQLIDKALEMPKEEADEMGVAGRKNIEENFSNEKMCNETIKVYREVLKRVV
jgi:glycosyltransferase involved in cell wall biosynthesis